MAVKVGSARLGETGSTNQKAGDQSGSEVSTQNWYKHSKGWVVLRPDSKYADKIADAMEAACKNNNVGYDQTNRNTLYNAVKTKGYNPAKATSKVECDCSSLVRVCCCYAGIIVGDFNTSSEASVLMKTGKFTKLTDSKYTAKSDYLKRGDILVTKTKGHTVIVLSNGSKAGSSSSPSSSSSSTPTYKVGTTYTLQVDRLTVRTGAGTNNRAKTYSQLTANAKQNAYSNGTLKKGTRVTCQATKKVGSDVWMKIPSGWIAAYYSKKTYIK